MPRDTESAIDEAVDAVDHRSQFPASAGGGDPLLFDVRLECCFETTIRVEGVTALEAERRAKDSGLEKLLPTGMEGLVTVISTRVVRERETS
jgi:hypothetical protein